MLDDPSRSPASTFMCRFCARKVRLLRFLFGSRRRGAGQSAMCGALTAEMGNWWRRSCSRKRSFFGGGTPSLLNRRQWEAIFKAMDRLNLLGAAEWTVECKSATISADKARLLAIGA